jgi:predicted outer membrane protein
MKNLHRSANQVRRAQSSRLRLACCVLAFAGAAQIGWGAASPPTPASAEFATAALRSVTTLQESAQAADQASANEAVRNFAGRLATDSEQMSEALIRLFKEKGIALPPAAGPSAASVLPERSGPTFDRVFTLEVAQQLARIEAVFAASERNDKIDGELKALAREKLSLIRKHRTEADALARKHAGVKAASSP